MTALGNNQHYGAQGYSQNMNRCIKSIEQYPEMEAASSHNLEIILLQTKDVLSLLKDSLPYFHDIFLQSQ